MIDDWIAQVLKDVRARARPIRGRGLPDTARALRDPAREDALEVLEGRALERGIVRVEAANAI